MSSGCGGGVVAHLVEHGEHLPSDVALQTADDLLFGLALLEAPRHVVLGRRVVAQPHHHDPVQRSVGLAVTAAVEAVAGGLARGRLDRGDTAQHRERRVAAQPVGLSPAATSSAPALSWPTPNNATSLGAALAVSRSSSVVRELISAERAWWRCARVRSASMAAASGLVILPGSSSAAARTSRLADRPRSCSRSPVGAVTSSALSALIVCVRARIAVWRATRSERIISTWPSPAPD